MNAGQGIQDSVQLKMAACSDFKGVEFSITGHSGGWRDGFGGLLGVVSYKGP